MIGRLYFGTPAVCVVAILSIAAGPATSPTTTAAILELPNKAVSIRARAAALKPYMAFAWAAPAIGTEHVQGFCWVQPRTFPPDAARATNRMPEGCRVLLAKEIGQDRLLSHPDDRCRDAAGRLTREQGIWPEQGIRDVARGTDAFFRAFASAGGQCDLLVIDFEQGYSNWVMTPERLAAIGRDSRFPAVARRLGFDDPTRADFRVSNRTGEFLRWNAVTGEMVWDALEQSIARPLKQYLPAAAISAYGAFVMTPENAAPDGNGIRQYTTDRLFGSYQSPATYGAAGQIRLRIPGDWDAPFTSVLWAADTVRCCIRSSTAPVLPWVAWRGYASDPGGKVAWAGTGYWEEAMYHVALSGASSNFLFFNPPPPGGGLGKQNHLGALGEDTQAMNQVMADLQRLTRGSPLIAPLISDRIDYAARSLVSAAITESGLRIARVTFAEGTDEMELKIGSQPIKVRRREGKLGTWVVIP